MGWVGGRDAGGKCAFRGRSHHPFLQVLGFDIQQTARITRQVRPAEVIRPCWCWLQEWAAGSRYLTKQLGLSTSLLRIKIAVTYLALYLVRQEGQKAPNHAAEPEFRRLFSFTSPMLLLIGHRRIDCRHG